jgi:hypothetical protein
MAIVYTYCLWIYMEASPLCQLPDNLHLTFESLTVTIRTTSFKITKFCMVITLHVYFVWLSEQTVTFALYIFNILVFITEVFTARYGLCPYIAQIRLVVDGLMRRTQHSPLDFILSYLPYYDFSIDMSDDGLKRVVFQAIKVILVQ